MRLVFTTFVTYLKAHWLQKLLLTPLIRETVKKYWKYWKENIFYSVFRSIKSAAPARITSISSASENSNETSFYDLRYLLKSALATKIITQTSYTRNSNRKYWKYWKENIFSSISLDEISRLSSWGIEIPILCYLGVSAFWAIYKVTLYFKCKSKTPLPSTFLSPLSRPPFPFPPLSPPSLPLPLPFPSLPPLRSRTA